MLCIAWLRLYDACCRCVSYVRCMPWFTRLAHRTLSKASCELCKMQHATNNMQRARAIVYCVSFVAFCAGMLHGEVVRRGACRVAYGPLQLPFFMSAVVLLMPAACCMLHVASLLLHLQHILRSEHRTLHRVWDSVAITDQRCVALVCTRVHSCAGIPR